MAFDFNNIEDELMKFQDGLNPFNWEIIYKNNFEKTCDSLSPLPTRNDKVQTRYLEEKGHFVADTFFMVSPYIYLGIRLHPCHNCFYNGILFIHLGPDADFKSVDLKKLEINVIDEKTKTINQEVKFDIENVADLPIVVFQGNRNEDIGECGCTYPTDRSIWTASDLLVFRGVFKATKSKDTNNYGLEKIWDRYYFGYPVINSTKKK